MAGEIVKTVHEVESLRISQFLAYFFNTAVNITHVDIDLLYSLSVYRRTETEHAMGSRVLRTDIHNEIIRFEHTHFLCLNSSVLILNICCCEITLTFTFSCEMVVLGTFVIILTQWIPVPINAEEQTTHIGIADKDNSEEVIDLTFENSGNLPKISYAVQHGLFTVGSCNLHGDMLIMCS